MREFKVIIVGALFVLFFPFLAKAQLLWFDDFEHDTIGGPARDGNGQLGIALGMVLGKW